MVFACMLASGRRVSICDTKDLTMWRVDVKEAERLGVRNLDLMDMATFGSFFPIGRQDGLVKRVTADEWELDGVENCFLKN